MRVAIVGTGVAGLAVCWHLLQKGATVTLFDRKGIAGGASGVSTGLLHPFPGRIALRSWRASEGMAATEELIAIAEKALGIPVAERSGVFRPAHYDYQRSAFTERASKDADAIWCEKSPFGMGLWIPKGITLFSPLYLKGLWYASQALGAELVTTSISSLKELECYDQILLATGYETLQFEECRHLPLSITKGQTLLCRWPERLPFSLVSQGHITPTEDPAFCQIGSTYERDFSSLDPDPSTALKLKEKVALFYPPARDFEVVQVKSGARLSRKGGYRPIVAKVAPKTWVFTGLGSRGMLYHACLGKELANMIANNLYQHPLKSREFDKEAP